MLDTARLLTNDLCRSFPAKSLPAQDALTNRAQRGDLNAFNELVLQYQDQVFRHALWLLGDDAEAEDAAQEVFLRAYRKMQTFSGPSFRAWILRITSNYCIDRIRLKKRTPTCPLAKLYPDDEEETEPGSWVTDSQPSPEQVAEWNELSQVIRRGLMALEPAYRTPIVLVDIHGMNYDEAAAAMGIPLGSFKSRLSRARAKLSALIRRDARVADLPVAS